MSNHLCHLSDYAPINAAFSRNGMPNEIRQGVGLQSDVLGHGMTANNDCQPA